MEQIRQILSAIVGAIILWFFFLYVLPFLVRFFGVFLVFTVVLFILYRTRELIMSFFGKDSASRFQNRKSSVQMSSFGKEEEIIDAEFREITEFSEKGGDKGASKE